jgi:hypothetical protein
MAKKPKPQPREAMNEDFLKPREAALELRISFPTIKQWIYKPSKPEVIRRSRSEPGLMGKRWR